MDWLWFGRDPWQQEIAGKLQSFYCEKQSGHWDGVFLTDGTLLRERALHPVAVIAVNAEASRREKMQRSASEGSGRRRFGQGNAVITTISCICLPCWHCPGIIVFTE